MRLESNKTQADLLTEFTVVERADSLWIVAIQLTIVYTGQVIGERRIMCIQG